MLTKLEEEIIAQVREDSKHLYCDLEIYSEIMSSMFVREECWYYEREYYGHRDWGPITILVVAHFFGDLEIIMLENFELDFLVSPTTFGEK